MQPTVYRRYERGEREVPAWVIFKLARYYKTSADYILDFGPKAGVHGGQVVAQGTPQALGKHRSSVTGPYLSGKKSIPIPKNRRMTKELAQQCPTRETK
jgi:hypothetical protein